MITTAAVISIIFRIVNFGVIIGLVAYLFKYRALPIIYKKIEERNEESRSLEEQQVLLVARHKQLLQELADSEKTAIVLKNRIDRWQQAVAQEMVEREMQKEQQRQYVQQQIEKKEYERVREKEYAKVTRAAITQVQQTIGQQLSDEKKSQAFFAHLINSLGIKNQ